MHNQLLVFATV